MDVQEGLFCSYIKSYPLEIERMFNAVEYVVNEGIGGAILDNLTPKTFKDTKEEYLKRLIDVSLSREDGLNLIFKALLCWYETWKDSFKDFNVKNAKVKFCEQPIHTWLYCLFTGQQSTYQMLSNSEFVMVSQAYWEEVQSKAGKLDKFNTFESREDISTEKKEIMDKLYKLYNTDKEVQIKVLLFEKKIAVFLEKQWCEKRLLEIQEKYNLLSIRQFSSIELTSDPGMFDYYLFLTSQATHSAKYKLERNIPRNKLFMISSTNIAVVMDDFIKQLGV